MVCDRVESMRILVGPERVVGRFEKTLHTSDSRLQILTGDLVRLLDHVDLRSVSFQQANVLHCCLRINDADKAQPVIHASLREADTHVSGTRLDHDCVRLDFTAVNRVADDAKGRPVLRAAAWIQALQLCVELKARVRNHARQSHQRCVANGRQYAVIHNLLQPDLVVEFGKKMWIATSLGRATALCTKRATSKTTTDGKARPKARIDTFWSSVAYK